MTVKLLNQKFIQGNFERGHLFTEFNKQQLLLIDSQDNVWQHRVGVPGSIVKGRLNSQYENPRTIPELSGTGIIRFFNGYHYVLGLTRSRTVYAWGVNNFGQLGRGQRHAYPELQKPEKVEQLGNIVQLACGAAHSMALTGDGQVYSWGHNVNGQLALNMDADWVLVPTKINFDTYAGAAAISFIHCCHNSSFAITGDGRVYSWGMNWKKVLGTEHTDQIQIPVPVMINLVNIVAVVSNNINTYFLNSDGLIYYCGEQQPTPRLTSKSKYISLCLLDSCYPNIPVLAIAESVGLCELRAADEVVSLGNDYSNYEDYYLNKYNLTFNLIDFKCKQFVDYFIYDKHTRDDAVEDDITKYTNSVIDKFKQNYNLMVKSFCVFPMAGGGGGVNAMFITLGDQCYGFGTNSDGSLGLGHRAPVLEPHLIKQLSYQGIQELVHGDDFIVAIDRQSKLYTCGQNRHGQLGRGDIDTGAFGPGNNYLYESIYMPNNRQIIQLTSGSHHTLALTADGQLYGWGDNHWGQVGCGKQLGMKSAKNTHSYKPTQLMALKNVHYVHCAGNTSMALTKSGRLYIWGQTSLTSTHMKTNTYEEYPREIVFGGTITPSIELDRVLITSFNNQLFKIYFLTKQHDLYVCSTIEKLYTNNWKLTDENDLLWVSILNGLENELVKIHTDHNQFDDYYLETYRSTNHLVNQFNLDNLDLLPSSSSSTNMKNGNASSSSIDADNADDNVLPKMLADQFEIISEIGQGKGQYGKIYHIKQIDQGQSYALKSLKIDTDNCSESNMELDILISLQSDHVVKFHNAWQLDSQLFIQMDLYDQDLDSVLENKHRAFGRAQGDRLDPIEYVLTCQLLQELIAGLDYLHSHQPPVIHRDLKPANILVASANSPAAAANSTAGTTTCMSGYLKISDFGLSTYHERQSISHTQGTGTPLYMAPEVSWGRSYNEMADIYSLGILTQVLFNWYLSDSQQYSLNANTITVFEARIGHLFLAIKQMYAQVYAERPSARQLAERSSNWTINRTEIIGAGLFRQKPQSLKRPESQLFRRMFTDRRHELGIKFDKKFVPTLPP
ncbi:uncharacterized protein LOC128957219 [Oppia nitens]|uniref:uncharacterized protein LOC128957219 n=1 Tax=Oppia nitens TaxID=1686743 RepID=UPI0023D9A65E|nr:uncharacterized protein LOC128957219 [Oppia nitens]